uniref:GATA-type domain-containing protein n=1 Tax=Caenorhabditis tropicalis TaxID=1561998 RepID=A0A1I7T2U8_9PELO
METIDSQKIQQEMIFALIMSQIKSLEARADAISKALGEVKTEQEEVPEKPLEDKDLLEFFAAQLREGNNTPKPPKTCENCLSDQTTVWRRDGEGKRVCNACGLYYKNHKKNRPVSLNRGFIQRRRRTTVDPTITAFVTQLLAIQENVEVNNDN